MYLRTAVCPGTWTLSSPSCARSSWLLDDEEVALALEWARAGTHNKQLLQSIRCAEMIKSVRRRGLPLSLEYVGDHPDDLKNHRAKHVGVIVINDKA